MLILLYKHGGGRNFQDDNASIQTPAYDQSEVSHLDWPSQLPDRFQRLSPLKDIKHVLLEE